MRTRFWFDRLELFVSLTFQNPRFVSLERAGPLLQSVAPNPPSLPQSPSCVPLFREPQKWCSLGLPFLKKEKVPSKKDLPLKTNQREGPSKKTDASTSDPTRGSRHPPAAAKAAARLRRPRAPAPAAGTSAVAPGGWAAEAPWSLCIYSGRPSDPPLKV